MNTLLRKTFPIWLLTVCVATAVQAQYFGQNKVLYDTFDFKILHTPHFNIYYYPTEGKAIPDVARMAERWYARHSSLLADTLKGVQPLIVYASSPQFQETNVVQGIGVGTGGVTEPEMRRIVLSFAGPLRETDHVVGHELVHAFQFDITGQGHGGSSGIPGAEALPLWFVEGMAEYLSLGPDDANTAMWMRDATEHHLPSLSELGSQRFFPYRFGQAFLAYLDGIYGDRFIGPLLRKAGDLKNVNAALDSLTGVQADTLVERWHRALHSEYDTLRAQTKDPTAFGRKLISADNGGGDLNVSPVLSPDGTRLVFYSTRGEFAVDLYLADARSGKVERKLFSMETNPHLESLQFINSAGAWDPSGTRFAFAGTRKGRPILTILDLVTEEQNREIPFPNLGEIYDPTWAPDGSTIIFSALHSGSMDLYLYNLETSSLQQLTDDPYADLQPAWSPDGDQVAFVTDRFGTNLDRLSYGPYRLAIMNVQTHAIQSLPTFTRGKSIDPQWSPDGKSIYFLSDQDGITNIYRLDMSTGASEQITNIYTGISGITDLSPALSVARQSKKVAFSAFENRKYSIYLIDSLRTLGGTPPVAFDAPQNPAMLPPPAHKDPVILANLDNPGAGLPPDTSYRSTDYSTSFRLAGIIQPTVSAGYSAFGSYLGGGVGLLWSDILGNKELLTNVSAQSVLGSFEFSGVLGYFNQGHRLGWGAFAQQVPYINASYYSAYDTLNGQLAYFDQQLVFREIDRQVSGQVSYPFSEVARIDGSLGYRNISFDNELSTQAYSTDTGQQLLDRTDKLPGSQTLNLMTVGGAFVYDNSLMGATGPLLGGRGRLEISPTFGSLNWIDLLADYRQYVMPFRPLTLAGRILHVGRYGAAAEDPRLAYYYLGDPGLVRGYDQGIFSSSSDPATFDVYTRLYGTRMLIGNLEARAPLFGLFGVGEGYYGFFPIDLVLFGDAGAAWTSDLKPTFLGGPQKPVFSTGVGLRINVFGLVGEVDYVRPLSLPNEGWDWQFTFAQGI
jgi:hypothetical protein